MLLPHRRDRFRKNDGERIQGSYEIKVRFIFFSIHAAIPVQRRSGASTIDQENEAEGRDRSAEGASILCGRKTPSVCLHEKLTEARCSALSLVRSPHAPFVEPATNYI